MRRLYTLLLYLALPFAVLLGPRRGRRERCGFGPQRGSGGIWIHAVSVGEVQAAAILVRALRERAHAPELTLTCATATGRARAQALMPDVPVRYAPYDLPGSLRRCFTRLRPRLLILIETELWPNLLHQARRAGVPTLIASARVSERTARFYRRMPGLLRAALQANVWVGAQTAGEARRFGDLGVPAERLWVVGNIKFDRVLSQELAPRGAALRAQYAAGRPVWVAGSTHPGEEQILLEAHRQLLRTMPQAVLVLAPRHPQRFDETAAAVQTAGLRCLRRSRTGLDAQSGYEVVLLDTIGELMEFYAAGDAAFVGGSLVPVGGHNLLEPAALGLPVLSGPQQFNSPELARILTEHAGLTTVQDAAGLVAALARLLGDPDERGRQGARARAAIEANGGALARVLQLIDQLR
ncbi:MAG: 3-deoxy-D-manno-octulosonic acid transferase [Steroidobacteraceae bacterium]